MNQLTIKEALEQGYTYCGKKSDSYNSLHTIKDLHPIDFGEDKLYLYSKQGVSPAITAECLKDMISDHMESDWGNDTGDDSEQVYEKAMELNYEPFADMINAAMADIVSYSFTEIELIP